MRNLFKKQTTQASEVFDPALYTPVIRASVCTGEKVAGFRGQDGKLHEIMLIRNERDLDAFREQYGIRGDIEMIY